MMYKYLFVECIRAIAVILIINSHAKGIWPSDLLSFGGGLGLGLFYLLSGFLLKRGVYKSTSFVNWYMKKICRIYIPLWIYTTIEVILNYVEISSFQDVLYYYVFPTNYWFAISIVILYALYYRILKFNLYKSSCTVVYVIFLICILFIFVIILHPSIAFFSLEKLTWNTFSLDPPYLCMQLIWLICMLIGSTDISSIVNNKNTFYCYVLIFLGMVLYCVPKLVEKIYNWVIVEAFLPISYIIFSIGIFSLLQNKEDFFQKKKYKLRTIK